MNIQDVYQQSCDMIMPYIRFEGRDTDEQPDMDKAEQCLQDGIQGLKSVIAEIPDSWTAYWMMGKAYQALDENEKAYEAFLVSHKINLGEENALRELALQCVRTKRFDQAVYYSEAAQKFDPEDATLMANLAVAKLFQNKLDESAVWATKCLQKLPGDEPSLVILKVIERVKAGHPMPNSIDELESENWDE